MNYSLSTKAEKLILSADNLPASIASRLREICPQHPDPEPYPDGTYGEYSEISAECLAAFLAFHRTATALGHPGVSPGRGETSLGVQFINPDVSDDYLMIDFEKDGSGRAIEKLAGSTNDYSFVSGYDFADQKSPANLAYFVKQDAARIVSEEEYSSQGLTV